MTYDGTSEAAQAAIEAAWYEALECISAGLSAGYEFTQGEAVDLMREPMTEYLRYMLVVVFGLDRDSVQRFVTAMSLAQP